MNNYLLLLKTIHDLVACGNRRKLRKEMGLSPIALVDPKLRRDVRFNR